MGSETCICPLCKNIHGEEFDCQSGVCFSPDPAYTEIVAVLVGIGGFITTLWLVFW